ncbi:MAG: ATP synthase F1 subunit epsilon [Nitrospinae bacterium]|nr:ATP synthase F1 subunit epsilon [Nitrospinota bacterium]
MNEKEFQLEIITPQKVVYREDVVSVTAPGKEGYLGILANHAALLTSLKPGKIEIRKAGDLIPVTVRVQSGFLETSNNKVVVLVDKAEIEE